RVELGGSGRELQHRPGHLEVLLRHEQMNAVPHADRIGYVGGSQALGQRIHLRGGLRPAQPAGGSQWRRRLPSGERFRLGRSLEGVVAVLQRAAAVGADLDFRAVLLAAVAADADVHRCIMTPVMTLSDGGPEPVREEEGHTASADGLSLYWRGWLPASPHAVLLFVHGLAEHAGRYQNPAHYFAPRGYACYAFDYRGHGRSPGPRVHVDRFDEF